MTSAEDRVAAELFGRLLANSAIPIAGVVLGTTLIGATYWPSVNHRLLLAWMGLVFCAAALRALLTLRMRRQAESHGIDPAGAARYAWTFAISGLAWGLGGLLTAKADPMSMVVTVTGCQAMVMGAVSTLSAFMPAFLAFSVPAMVPMLTALAARGDVPGIVLTVYNAIFFLLMIGIALNSHRSLRRSLILAIEKERMECSLRQWMADTSHELRTPLTVLRAQVEAVQDGIHAADAKSLGVLHREAMTLTRLVDDLHTLARSDIGQLECRRDPVDLLDLLDDIASAFRGRYAAAGLGLEWQKNPPDIPALVSGDASRLQQVLSNLFENTLRYTDPGGRLRVHAVAGVGTITLQFDDTAPAVPPAALPRLFDRFFRVDPSRSRERGGTGVGLAICRSIVAAHDGQITAEPSPLGGLRISIVLPCLSHTA